MNEREIVSLREIKGTLYRIKTYCGNDIFVETSDGEEGFAELCKFCAGKEARGYHITSVVKLESGCTATPRVSVFNTKAFKDEANRLLEMNKGANS